MADLRSIRVIAFPENASLSTGRIPRGQKRVPDVGFEVGKRRFCLSWIGQSQARLQGSCSGLAPLSRPFPLFRSSLASSRGVCGPKSGHGVRPAVPLTLNQPRSRPWPSKEPPVPERAPEFLPFQSQTCIPALAVPDWLLRGHSEEPRSGEDCRFCLWQ